MVKPYLIKTEDDNLNNTLRTKYYNQKNGHEKNYTSITGSITIDLIPIIVITLLINVDFLINLPNDYDCKAVTLSLTRKNSN